MRIDKHLDYVLDVQDQGADPSGIGDATAAFLVSCYQASSQPAGGTVVAVGRFKTNNTVIIPSGTKLDLTSAVIVPTADVNLFQVKPGGQLRGGTIDTSGITFTHAVVFLDGKDKFGVPQGTTTTRTFVKDMVLIGGTGAGKGMAVYFDSEAPSGPNGGYVIGVTVEGLRTFGFTYVIRTFRTGVFATNFNNGNIFRDIWSTDPVYFLHMDNSGGTQGTENDGNQFIACQLEWGADTLRAVYCNGSGNQFYLYIWDVPSVIAVEYTTGSGSNILIWNNEVSKITDPGTTNTSIDGISGKVKAPSLVVRIKAGTPTDSDFTSPVDGLVVVDTTANKIWTRIGGTWKGVVVA